MLVFGLRIGPVRFGCLQQVRCFGCGEGDVDVVGPALKEVCTVRTRCSTGRLGEQSQRYLVEMLLVVTGHLTSLELARHGGYGHLEPDRATVCGRLPGSVAPSQMMESKQFMSEASRPASVLVWAVLAFVVLLTAGAVACGSGRVVEPVTVATPPAIGGDGRDLPSSTAGAEDADSLDSNDLSDRAVTPTDISESSPPGPLGRIIESVEPVRDRHGNLLAVHAISAWPASFARLQPIGRGDISLMGPLDEAFGSATSMAAIDLSVCARTLGDVDVADTTGTFTVGNGPAVPSERDGNGSFESSDSSLQPGFVWPSVGACSRGWLAVATTADLTSDLYAHYWPSGDDAGQGVLAWQAPLVTGPTGANSFAAGETITFNAGTLAGATVVIDGWAELVEASEGPVGTRPVGMLAQTCPSSSGEWPEIGLSVDGWNLAEASSRVVDGLDPLSASPDACDTGWLVFDVPHGGVVTGAFVAERADTPGAHWSLLGSAIADPS